MQNANKEYNRFLNRKVGSIVRVELRSILETKDIGGNRIAGFQQADYSHEILGLNYPLLHDCAQVLEDHLQRRYYSTPVNINGKEYKICNHWFERHKGRLLRGMQVYLESEA